MDWVVIEELQAQVHVGVPEVERRNRQKLLIDLELGLDLKKAGETDAVEETVDYAAVVLTVRRFVEAGSFQLVERVAEGVATLVRQRFPPIEEVRVKVRKFSVPGTRSVGVAISRGSSRKKSGSPTAGPR